MLWKKEGAEPLIHVRDLTMIVDSIVRLAFIRGKPAVREVVIDIVGDPDLKAKLNQLQLVDAIEIAGFWSPDSPFGFGEAWRIQLELKKAEKGRNRVSSEWRWPFPKKGGMFPPPGNYLNSANINLTLGIHANLQRIPGIESGTISATKRKALVDSEVPTAWICLELDDEFARFDEIHQKIAEALKKQNLVRERKK